MATIVYRYFGGEIEKIAQLDASLLYGNVVFSTFKAMGGDIPWWDKHIERLKRGASFLLPNGNWDCIQRILQDGKVKFMLHFQKQEWMGRPTLKHTEDGLQLIFYAWEAPLLEISSMKLAVALCERRRLLPRDIKGGDYRDETQGRQWAIDLGMDDILFWQGPQKELTETSRSNIFLINAKEEILTPKTCNDVCLAGIAREQVINLIKKMGLKVREREIYLSELNNMKEAFLTNCGQWIIPVSQINDNFFSSYDDISLTNKLKKELNSRVPEI